MNLASYVSNQVTIYVDPSGLAVEVGTYIPNRVVISPLKLPKYDYARRANGELASEFKFTWNPIAGTFAKGCSCELIGVAQIYRTRILYWPAGYWADFYRWRDTSDWKLDGGIPYPFVIGKNTVDPTITPPGIGEFYDNPGGVELRGPTSLRAKYFSQDFETHLVCIKGPEKGAVYGGITWSHTYTFKTSEHTYYYSSQATNIQMPSDKWKAEVKQYFADMDRLEVLSDRINYPNF